MIKAPKFFYQSELSILVILLLPVSLINIFCYFVVYKLRQIIHKKTNYNGKIVCVGNITLGGSGKTEICLEIGRFLRSKGVNFCYLTRGYGRKSKENLLISHNSHVNLDKIGDEASLLSKIADVAIYNDKSEFISSDIAKKYDVIITDDGLHNPSFHKDITICLFDGNYLDGNGLILPAGPLRFPISFFAKKVDYLVFTNVKNAVNIGKFEKVKTQLKLDRYFTSEILCKPMDLTKKYIAFSGLGINQKFFQSLKDLSVNLIKTIEFPDHYKYSDNDIENLITTLNEGNADFLITTSKDFVKIHQKYHQYIQILAINHTLTADFYDIFWKKLVQ